MLILNFNRATIASLWHSIQMSRFSTCLLLLNPKISFHIGKPSHSSYVIEYWYTKIASRSSSIFFSSLCPLNTMGHRIKNSLSSWSHICICNVCVYVCVGARRLRRPNMFAWRNRNQTKLNWFLKKKIIINYVLIIN